MAPDWPAREYAYDREGFFDPAVGTVRLTGEVMRCLPGLWLTRTEPAAALVSHAPVGRRDCRAKPGWGDLADRCFCSSSVPHPQGGPDPNLSEK